MAIKKYSVLTLVVYVLAYFSPSFVPTLNAQITTTIVAYILGALLMIFLYTKQERKLSFEIQPASWLICLIIGSLGIFGAGLVQTLALQIEQFFGESATSANTSDALSVLFQQPFFLLTISIGAPIMEEFVFRRTIVDLLEPFINIWLAISLSSLLFAVIHFDGHILLYFSLGFFFSLLYRFTGRIWTSILAHAGMNTIVVLVQLLT